MVITHRRAAAFLLAGAIAAGLSCTRRSDKKSTTVAAESDVDLKGMDASIAPGDDFYDYANGSWMKAASIPADKAYFGVISELADSVRQRLRTLIEESAGQGSAKSEDSRKIGEFYSSFMDEAAIEAKGIGPLKPEFDIIAAVADRKALARVIGSQLRADVDALNSTNFETDHLFGIWITQGLTDPSRTYSYLLQGGLGLPDRDYYISSAPKMADLRKQYEAHIGAMFRLAGFSDPAARAERVFALETKMAQTHATRVESEDVRGAVSWTRSDLAAKASGLDWEVALEAAGLKDAPVLIIWHPKAIRGLAALATGEPLDSWKDWLVFHAISRSAAWLPKAFGEESFRFFGTTLSGTPQIRPRWQRGMDFTSRALGEVAGKLYIERHFPAASKAKVQAIVADLMTAFGKRIDALAWMSPETKAKATAKLSKLRVGVGYPDKWRDYSRLEIRKGDAYGNWERAGLFAYHQQLEKLHQPIDRGEWWMTPQTVNAVNLPLQNALNFPAAYIQPPYFDPNADAAYNYGSMGATIGHEISHSFDDQGSQFDGEGRLVNWWTKEDFGHFKAAGEALAKQFDGYKPFPDVAVNGHQTLSENIADVAGLLAAYDAYKLSLQGKPDIVKNGFTGDQRFFISFGQSWRGKVRDEALRRQLATDGHAPNQYRALTVRNLDAWYEAFSVKAAQKLFLEPAKRVRVW